MSTNYIEILHNSEVPGTLAIATSVISDIVKYTLADSKYVEIENRLLQQNRGITIKYDNDILVINIDVDVKYGNRVIGVVEKIQSKIFQAVTTSTSIQNVVVNVWVVGFTF